MNAAIVLPWKILPATSIEKCGCGEKAAYRHIVHFNKSTKTEYEYFCKAHVGFMAPAEEYMEQAEN